MALCSEPTHAGLAHGDAHHAHCCDWQAHMHTVDYMIDWISSNMLFTNNVTFKKIIDVKLLFQTSQTYLAQQQSQAFVYSAFL